jgi:alpha-1,3-glucosyltransferase
MAKICLLSTATAIVPSSISLLFRPKKRQFLYALINSSLAFFLFSFQVHEKSILIAAMPVALIFPLDPFMSIWFLQISTFSMLPLLIKDGLTSAFIGLSGAYFLLIKIAVDNMKSEKHVNMSFLSVLWNLNKSGKRSEGKLMENLMIFSYIISTIAQILLVVAFFFIAPPPKLPFLHPLLISAFSCCHFLFFFLYFNVKQIFYE